MIVKAAIGAPRSTAPANVVVSPVGTFFLPVTVVTVHESVSLSNFFVLWIIAPLSPIPLVWMSAFGT